jgi:bifunctional UDP-N-acetylglucosamine pyrophosphorylase/glucosamine-1-phosphate N-acetyltransferase
MLNVVILAAGQGKRMHSDLPKVLHRLAGKPILGHVIDTVSTLAPDTIYVVYGHQGETLKQAFADAPVEWVHQAEQKGTAHAVEQVLPLLNDDSVTIILSGDVPLVSIATLQALHANLPAAGVCLLVANVNDPTGLGRIIRNDKGQITAIIEDKDATAEQRQIHEIYSGIMAIHTGQLRRWLKHVDDNNAQKEFYLTTIPLLALKDQCPVTSVAAANEMEILGVNTKTQLALLERRFQFQQAEKLMNAGVTILDPYRFDLRGNLQAGRDVVIDVNVIVEGQVTLGNRVTIGPNCVLRNVAIGDDVTIKENSILEDSLVDKHCVIGPFSRLRPETHLAEGAHIGNFVEVKKSLIGSGSKINHLTYIGDATIGQKVNVGAGTITCNYDGVNKHKTTISDNAFIGSNTSLVAPISIGENATIAAGSTITKDAPANTLTISRAKQATVPGWQRPTKPQKEK